MEDFLLRQKAKECCENIYANKSKIEKKHIMLWTEKEIREHHKLLYQLTEIMKLYNISYSEIGAI